MTDPHTPEDITAEEVRRLRWQCRRGMLELDHLLMPFLERGYAALDAAGRADFTTLLAQQDQDLSDWFMSRRVADDPRLHRLIQHILEVVAAAPIRGPGRSG
jgi:antitoxin CptB